MSFNSIFLLWFLFVLTPIILKNQKWDPNNYYPDFSKLLNYIFGKVPKIKSEIEHIVFRLALSFAVFLLYLSLKLEDSDVYSDTFLPTFVHLLCLANFAYIAHLMSDELFDTAWNSTISLFSFFFVFTLISGIIHFVLIETDWTIIWMNRRTLLVGPNFISQFGDEIWRLWPPFYFLMILIGAGYGTLGEDKKKFIVPYAIFSLVILASLNYNAPYDSESKSGAIISGPDSTWGTTYKYNIFDDTSDFPEGWEERTFDDSSWLSGKTPFGNNNLVSEEKGKTINKRTTWESNSTDGSGDYLIIRKNFTIEDKSKILGATLRVTYPNYYAAYLNDQKIGDCLDAKSSCNHNNPDYWNKEVDIEWSWLDDGPNTLILVGQDDLTEGHDNITWLDTELRLKISNRGFDASKALVYLSGGFILGLVAFLGVHNYCKDAEEYIINYLQTILVNLGVISFIVMIILLDPPGEYEDDYFWNSDDLLGTGVKPAAWGGLVLNLIFAAAALVVGFGIGIALAFGRRSNLPVFWIPSVGVIELIRSGPLVAWLFFAQILVPDLLDPVWEADIASRVILVLSLFFGCYLAEVLRGGLQAVPHGQYEAATALGLSPVQTKMQIELPQAIRTTLPAIVSMMIGMLKDTSLVFFFGIYDAFRVAKDLPAQWDFIGQHEQSLLFVGMIFWGLSFYLSKVSRRIEKNLGLTHEGGGDVT